MTNAEYITLISREPTTEMVTEAKDKHGKLLYKFIPKSILQKELLLIYEGHDKWDIIKETTSKDGIWGWGVLQIKHPVSGEWISKTGMAALRHDKNMKLNYPNLEAQCFKNACKKIGAWFGQTLNLYIDDAEPETDTMNDEIDTSKSNHIIVSATPEYETVKQQLDSFEFKEDALEYLKKTSFPHYIPANKIANSKKSKINNG